LLSVKDVKGREGVIFKIIDPLGNAQQYVADDIDGTMALHYTIKASSIGTAGTVRNNRVTRSGIVVASGGVLTLKALITGKNASASAYKLSPHGFDMRRTA
jgi:hypothetical protein